MSTRVRLAGRIIEAREEAKLSQRRLAEAVEMNPGVLSRIEDATRLPSAEQLKKLVLVLQSRGVTVDSRLWHELLRKASEEHPGITTVVTAPGKAIQANAHLQRPWGPQLVPVARDDTALHEPDPMAVSSPEEMREALNEVLVWAGAPSLRELAARSGRSSYYLSKSTLSEMLKRPKLPPYDRYRVFLELCGITNLDPWVFTWRRLKLLERRDQIGA
ncbi:helix-turn-helix domain-containing protein [Streptomyces sp. NPDC007205]|uniref:helix-turn-helix domain-containing protein n=1 Tax=Streptomyces sp. NPDC007205 TaxID=3154316 RepID=UPI0033F361C7